MATNHLPTAPKSSRGAPLTDRDQSVAPFPLAADMPGRPWLDPSHMAEAANDDGMREAIEQRLARTVHLEIEEPFLSRFGKRAYASVDWFCFAVIILAPAAFAIAFIRWLAQ